jgi:hypothetical protein
MKTWQILKWRKRAVERSPLLPTVHRPGGSYSTLTLICFGLASSRRGSRMVRTPSL